MRFRDEKDIPRNYILYDDILKSDDAVRRTIEWMEEHICNDFGHQAHFGNKFEKPVVGYGHRWSKAKDLGMNRFYVKSLLAALIDWLTLRKTFKIYSWQVIHHEFNEPRKFYLDVYGNCHENEAEAEKVNEKFREMFGLNNIDPTDCMAGLRKELNDKVEKKQPSMMLTEAYEVRSPYNKDDIAFTTSFPEAQEMAKKKTINFHRMLIWMGNLSNEKRNGLNLLDYTKENVSEYSRDWFVHGIYRPYLQSHHLDDTTYTEDLLSCKWNDEFMKFVEEL